MPILKLDIDPETYGRLITQAAAERRPVPWQAEVALRRAVGLPFPPEPDGAVTRRREDVGPDAGA